MMYSNKLVCSVKANGKFLREDVRGNESTVYLPFKTEYSLFLKNLSSRRALVHVDIDDKSMTEGGLIVPAGQSIDLERPANFGNGRKFKFIEKTQEISDFRGDNPEDGLVVVKWQFEKPYTLNINSMPWTATPWNTNPIWLGGNYTSPNITYTASANTMKSAESNMINCCFNSSVGASEPQLLRSAEPQGITVEGSKSNQSFSSGYIGNLEGTLYSMVIKLYGGQRPIYVRERIQCSTCGRKWKTSFEFCPNCGTALKD